MYFPCHCCQSLPLLTLSLRSLTSHGWLGALWKIFFPISNMLPHCLPSICQSGVTHSFAAGSGKKCIYNTHRFSLLQVHPSSTPQLGTVLLFAIQTQSVFCCRIRKHLTPVLAKVIWPRCCCFCDLIFCISMHTRPGSSSGVKPSFSHKYPYKNPQSTEIGGITPWVPPRFSYCSPISMKL